MKINIDTDNIKQLNQQIESLTIDEIQYVLDFLNWNISSIKEQLIDRGFLLHILNNLDWGNEKSVKSFLDSELKRTVKKAHKNIGNSESAMIIIRLIESLETGTLIKRLKQISNIVE